MNCLFCTLYLYSSRIGSDRIYLTPTHPTYFKQVIAGKSIDADELAAYRSSHRSGSGSESIMEWAKKIVIFGSSIVGGVVIIFGIGRLSAGLGRGSSRKSLE
jgi:hypothetical protein